MVASKGAEVRWGGHIVQPRQDHHRSAGQSAHQPISGPRQPWAFSGTQIRVDQNSAPVHWIVKTDRRGST